MESNPDNLFFTLPSDSSGQYFPDNNGSRFRTKLPISQRLKDDVDYEVALLEISMPNVNFINVKSCVFQYYHPKIAKNLDIKFENQIFDDPAYLMEVLNQLLVSELSKYRQTVIEPVFRIHSGTLKIHITIFKGHSLTLPHSLFSALGFESESKDLIYKRYTSPDFISYFENTIKNKQIEPNLSSRSDVLKYLKDIRHYWVEDTDELPEDIIKVEDEILYNKHIKYWSQWFANEINNEEILYALTYDLIRNISFRRDSNQGFLNHLRQTNLQEYLRFMSFLENNPQHFFIWFISQPKNHRELYLRYLMKKQDPFRTNDLEFLSYLKTNRIDIIQKLSKHDHDSMITLFPYLTEEEEDQFWKNGENNDDKNAESITGQKTEKRKIDENTNDNKDTSIDNDIDSSIDNDEGATKPKKSKLSNDNSEDASKKPSSFVGVGILAVNDLLAVHNHDNDNKLDANSIELGTSEIQDILRYDFYISQVLKPTRARGKITSDQYVNIEGDECKLHDFDEDHVKNVIKLMKYNEKHYVFSKPWESKYYTERHSYTNDLTNPQIVAKFLFYFGKNNHEFFYVIFMDLWRFQDKRETEILKYLKKANSSLFSVLDKYRKGLIRITPTIFMGVYEWFRRTFDEKFQIEYIANMINNQRKNYAERLNSRGEIRLLSYLDKNFDRKFKTIKMNLHEELFEVFIPYLPKNERRHFWVKDKNDKNKNTMRDEGYFAWQKDESDESNESNESDEQKNKSNEQLTGNQFLKKNCILSSCTFTDTRGILHRVFSGVKDRNEFVSAHEINLNDIKYESIYVYSDLPKARLVGDVYAQLLRTVNVSERDSRKQVIYRRYEDRHYIPLARKYFDSIEILLTDHTGNVLPFGRRTSWVTLHIRKSS